MQNQNQNNEKILKKQLTRHIVKDGFDPLEQIKKENDQKQKETNVKKAEKAEKLQNFFGSIPFNSKDEEKTRTRLTGSLTDTLIEQEDNKITVTRDSIGKKVEKMISDNNNNNNNGNSNNVNVKNSSFKKQQQQPQYFHNDDIKTRTSSNKSISSSYSYNSNLIDREYIKNNFTVK
jgi:hypothetical protein